MSASNWAPCPACVAKERAKIELAGLPPDDCVDPYKFETFREDYEIYGAEDGTIVVDYSGWCQVCHIGLDFNTHHQFFGAES